VARGGKPTSDQQRSDPWHIITWLTELRVKRLIIENVWEFCKWGPVDPKTMKPIKEREGEYFWAWIETLRRLGFDPEWRKLNAADYGDATTRQRFILMARSDGRRVAWPTATHAKRPEGDNLDLFPALKPWRPAREIIDWSLRGQSIFARKKALAPKTLARIYAGALKFSWPEPYLVILRNHMAVRGLDEPIPALSAGGTHLGLAEPLVCGNRTNNTAKTADYPVGGITTTTGGGQFLAEPIILSQHSSGAPRSDADPLPTLTTGGAGAEEHPGCARPMPVEPFILNRGSDGYGETRAHSVEEPAPTATGRGCGYLLEAFTVNGRRGNEAKGVSTDPIATLDTKGGVWVLEPFVATVAHGTAAGDTEERRCHSTDDPLGTQHAGGGSFALVAPFVLSQGAGGVPRDVAAPVPTILGGGAHALISPYYGSGSGETCTSVEADPLPTATAKARFGMVVPVTNGNGGPGPRSTEQPVATMTTAKGGEFAVVMPVTHADRSDRVRGAGEPLPTVTGANRGELAFITAQHGEREGQTPRVHSVDEPAPTIAASGHTDLVMVEQVADGLGGYDILFRMLEPHELAAAMGFTSEDQAYEFAGTKTDQIKQIGNAVSVKKMKACVGALMADAAPRRRAKPAAAARVAA
jgi:DNA (cytosine-5)-methyltransferase 1